MFTLEQHVPIPPVKTASGELAVALMNDPTAPEVMAPSFELVLELVERDRALEGALVYKAEAYEREDVRRSSATSPRCSMRFSARPGSRSQRSSEPGTEGELPWSRQPPIGPL